MGEKLITLHVIIILFVSSPMSSKGSTDSSSSYHFMTSSYFELLMYQITSIKHTIIQTMEPPNNYWD